MNLSVGVTKSQRLTLSDGNLTHDAHSQSIDRMWKEFRTGGLEESLHLAMAQPRPQPLRGSAEGSPDEPPREGEGLMAGQNWSASLLGVELPQQCYNVLVVV